MTVRRVVANIAAEQTQSAKVFYGDILGLTIVMDMGWIVTFAGETPAEPQLSIATEGGSGTAVPDLSIEVDNLDDIHAAMIRLASPSNTGPLMSHGVYGVSMYGTHLGVSSIS